MNEQHNSELTGSKVLSQSKLKRYYIMAQKKSVVQAVETTPVVEAVKVKKVGIGSTIIELILSNPEMTNLQILEAVKAKFEKAETSYACIAWYKSKLRKEGRIGARTFAKKVKPQEQAAE
jgi:hypothetical protein